MVTGAGLARAEARPQSSAADSGVAARIVEASLACFARFGVSKTTLEDIAAEAGCSRATLYRYFPGKQALLEGVLLSEIARVAGAVGEAMADRDEVDEALAALFLELGRQFHEHDALQQVLAIEPEVVLPHVVFDGAERLFLATSALCAEHLERFVPAGHAEEAATWICRLAVSYLLIPSESFSLTDEASVLRFVRTFVAPGLARMHALTT